MADNAFEWAEKHHKKRRNAVHGEDEIALVLDDEFMFSTEYGENMEMHADFTLEECFHHV